MSSLFFSSVTKSPVAQLFPERREITAPFGGVTPGAFQSFGSSSSFFSVSGKFRSEQAITSTLRDGLANAAGAVAAANAGTAAIGGLIDQAEQFITAVENGASGGVFGSALERLGQEAEQIIDRTSFRGTNLLKEGETLNITLGSRGNGRDYDFRQVSFETLGFTATDGAKAAVQTVTRTVTEDVQVDVTRRDRLTERVENIAARTERLAERETRVQERITQVAERRDQLTARIDRLEAVEVRINDRLDAAGARPTDANDQRLLNLARQIDDFADVLEERGSTRLAGFVQDVADNTAERAGLTISLERLDRLETRLTKVGERIVRTGETLTRVEARQEQLTDRLATVRERQEKLTARAERIENRLNTLSDERLNQVVGTRTETVTREVTETIENPAAGSFRDVFGGIARALEEGDTEGARALINEVKGRVDRVTNQLDQIAGSIDRRTGLFGDIAKRLDDQVKVTLQTELDSEGALRKAAAILSDLSKVGRLFQDGAKSRLVELYSSDGPSPEPQENEE